MQSVKDSIAKVEKLVETNQKEIKLSMQNARVKAESTEKSVAGNKSAIKELNEKVKNFIKNAALSGNTSMGEGNLVQEIENNIQKLRDDLDDLKKYSDQEQRIIKNDLYTKLTKDDGNNIENNVMVRTRDMLD